MKRFWAAYDHFLVTATRAEYYLTMVNLSVLAVAVVTVLTFKTGGQGWARR